MTLREWLCRLNLKSLEQFGVALAISLHSWQPERNLGICAYLSARIIDGMGVSSGEDGMVFLPLRWINRQKFQQNHMGWVHVITVRIINEVTLRQH